MQNEITAIIRELAVNEWEAIGHAFTITNLVNHDNSMQIIIDIFQFEHFPSCCSSVTDCCLIMFLIFNFRIADWLKTCQIDDPGFEDCSRESIQGLFKQLALGKANIHQISCYFVWYHFENALRKHLIHISPNVFFLFIGIEGFDAIETIDPMKINRIKIFQGDGPVSINSSLSRASVTGFGSTEVVQSK